MGNRIIGYSDEGCCEPCSTGYEGETIYEACVEVMNVVHSIYFLLTRRDGLLRVSIMRSDAPDDWSNYALVGVTEIHHIVPAGTWIMRMRAACNLVWLFKQRGVTYNSVISKANDERETLAQRMYQKMKAKEQGLRGKHYDMAVKDDMIDSLAYAMNAKAEVRSAIGWYKSQLPKGVKKTVHSNYTEYTYGEKEVKKKMLQLIDVIFFNRKTKVVDYRKEIVAVDIEEAYMLAAQEYGKYNSKVHFRHAHCLFSFVEDDKEG